MADTIYYNETIDDQPITSENVPISEVTSESNTSTTPSSNTTISDASNPTKRIAFEVISTALNTKSKKILQAFEFTQSGALQIGLYEPGVRGDIKISPTGIVARDSAGLTTFALDGENGDATFSGTIQSGTLITGDVVVGDNNVRIDGENRRIIVYDEAGDARVLIGQF